MKKFHKYKECFKGETVEKVSTIISVILYLLISLIIIRNFYVGDHINNKFIIFEENAMNGALSQLQMFILVYLSLREQKSGYIAALLLNTYGVITLSVFVLIFKNEHAYHGISSYLGIFIIVTLVHRYKKNVKEQKRLLIIQYEKLRSNEKKLKKMAFFDDLTEVFNRRIFLEEIDLQVEFCSKKNNNFHVVFIDIDNFKKINDTYGHHVGDIVLKEIVRRMKEVLHDVDIIGRLGGDEFGILITRKMNKEEVLEYINHIRILLGNPIKVEGNVIKTTASFGIAEYPQHGENAIELIKNSDKAMYFSKDSGKNQIHFSK